MLAYRHRAKFIHKVGLRSWIGISTPKRWAKRARPETCIIRCRHSQWNWVHLNRCSWTLEHSLKSKTCLQLQNYSVKIPNSLSKVASTRCTPPATLTTGDPWCLTRPRICSIRRHAPVPCPCWLVSWNLANSWKGGSCRGDMVSKWHEEMSIPTLASQQFFSLLCGSWLHTSLRENKRVPFPFTTLVWSVQACLSNNCRGHWKADYLSHHNFLVCKEAKSIMLPHQKTA